MFIYHVTFLHKLPSVAALGLVPGTGESFGLGYAAHSRGKLFLTHPDGVSFWASRYEQIANDQTDYPEDGWVPVVISLELNQKEFDALEDDELGTRDAGEPAWWTSGKFPPADLAVWDGGEWVEMADVDAEKVQEMTQEAMDAGEQEFEEDGSSYWLMDFDVFLPPDEELVLEEDD